MKKLHLLFLLFLTSNFFLQAQITLTADDFPQIGESITTINCAANAGLTIGSPGTNQTYNFGSVVQIDTSSFTFVDPTTTPGTAEFPNATLAYEEEDAFVYFQETSNAVFQLGAYVDTSSNMSGQYFTFPFNPPTKIFEIPSTYNTSYTNVSGFTLTDEDFSGFGDSIRYTSVMEREVLFDGYGMVTTPNGTFNGLRERVYTTTYDTTSILSGGVWIQFFTDILEDTTYNWYAKDSNGPLVSVDIENGAISSVSYTTLEVVIISPDADFSITNMGGGTFGFNDLSANSPTSWMWDFGDGNTSTLQSPQHTYAAAGTYTVCLTVTNGAGSDMLCQTVTVVFAPVVAFNFTDQGGGVFNFMDFSSNNPTSWLWDFGDGNTSTMQNPQHTYAAPGNYNVCLTATNASGSGMSCSAIALVFPPIAGYTSMDLGAGTVDFSDNSSNDPTSWLWDFGDGTTSTDQNPQHIFTAPGTYNVCLTVTNSAGMNTICMDVVIVFAPVAAFSFAVDMAENGVVDFTDASTNTPTSWMWDFGDGGMSSDQNPQYTFANSGMFNVCLTASNAGGSNMVCQMVDVIVTGTDDLLNSVKVEISPNPVSNILNVQLENNDLQNLDFQLYNSLGQPLVEMQVTTIGEYFIDVQHLSAGMYFYVLKDENGVIRNRGSVMKGNP